jgi:hypothetical protein
VRKAGTTALRRRRSIVALAMRYGDNADYWQMLSKMLRAKAKSNRMQELWFYHYAWSRALKERGKVWEL